MDTIKRYVLILFLLATFYAPVYAYSMNDLIVLSDAPILSALSSDGQGELDALVPVTSDLRYLACAMPLIAEIATRLQLGHDVSQLQQLCTDIHKGVELVPQRLLQEALEQALHCLRDIQIRLARELAVHWLFSLQHYLVQVVQQQLGIEPSVTPDPADDLQTDVWPRL
jgi:hypothetical protein